MLLPALLVLAIAPDPLFTGAAAAQTVSENPTDSKRLASHEVRRLQRLLKLLATRNPQRFASADPGVIDGVWGKGTVAAVRNFQRIIGVPENPKVTNALFAQILTADAESPLPAPTPNARPAAVATSAPAAKKQRHSATRTGGANPLVRYAQIGSMKDRERVETEWKRLEKTMPALGSQQPVLEVANLGSRGTYYRILVGPFEDYRRASDFCSELRKQRQSCLVKKATNTEPIGIGKPAMPTTETTPRPGAADSTRVDTAKERASAPTTQQPTPAAEPQSEIEITEPEIAAPQRAAVIPVEQSSADPVPALDSTTVIATTSTTSTQKPLESATEAQHAQPEFLAKYDNAPSPTNNTATAMDKAVSGDQRRQPAVAPATAVVQWLGRADRYTVQSYLAPTIAAAAGTIFGFLILVWHQRRRRNLAFEAILVSPWFEDSNREEADQVETFSQSEQEPEDLLEELRRQFDADDLAESRHARDTFLNGIPELNNASVTGYSGEYAMLVNRKLNQLLSSEPDTYKTIFLNWIFLNHVADRIASSEYTMKRLDPRIQDEFRLLASLFKIHLLELEARHHVRQRLPNIFAALNGL